MFHKCFLAGLENKNAILTLLVPTDVKTVNDSVEICEQK
jgi:hypothetical protein